ncbi:MAG: 1-acyl-sn-glycerol-3-phosphate acyltransferase [Scytonematopsis contorta HA4267-MV1]|jgi:1-acyl-sn-glycerol-3-phosphate acyltransferase|nr:1-acyl-sn-glycerol-3-phosphate acyltransferase [Scytonematopsis contorta HA4267-MV1]
MLTLQHPPTLNPEQSNQQKPVTPNLALNLTTEVIERAKLGVSYARNPHTSAMIEKVLSDAEEVAKGGRKDKTNGRLQRIMLQTVIRTLFKVKVEFPERIPTTPALVVGNHLNHIDPFILLSQLPADTFYNVLGDARSLYSSWWKRQIMSFVKGVIPLERIWKEEVAILEAAKAGREDLADLAAEIQEYVPKGNSIEAMRRLDRIVQSTFNRNEGIMLFPEGKLGSVEGKLLPLKRGVAIYALRSGMPIVPIAIVGTKDLYFGKEITLRVGEPITVKQSKRPKSEEVQAVLDELQAAMVDLLPKNYTEPKTPKFLRNFLNNLLV